MRAIEVNMIEYCEQLRVKEESPQAEAYRSTLIKQATNEFMKNTRYFFDSVFQVLPYTYLRNSLSSF